MNTFISAVQHIRPLRGGAQSHLLHASDGNYYVTKFQDNPQHIRVLANEMLGSRLGLLLGLPMPQVEVIAVSGWLIEHSPEMRLQIGGQQLAYKSGKQLGSLYVAQSSPGVSLDYLPNEMLKRVINVADFPRVLVLDKWTSNSDGRQAVFCRRTPRSHRYRATFIDQGYCFNASEWTFPDYPLRGVYSRNEVYDAVTGWESFEPALTRAEYMDPQSIWECAAGIPEEWYEGDRASLERLVDELGNRRKCVKKLIQGFQVSVRHPFPNWNSGCRL